MSVTVYLFLLAISIASGSYISLYDYERPSWIQPKFSFQNKYRFPYSTSAINPQTFIDECRLSHQYHSTLECYLKLQDFFRKNRNDPKPNLESQTLKANTENSIPGFLNQKNKPTSKPESYINSILDEGKRDASNLNASNSVLNSTWIEITDPRKTDSEIKSEIDVEKDDDEFVSFRNESTGTGEKANAPAVEEKRNKTNSKATDGLYTDVETTTEIQETTTITETSDVVTTRLIEESTTVTGETSYVTLSEERIGEKTTAKQNHTVTVDIDVENQGNTNVQMKTADVSSSENTEKSTITHLQTDSVSFEFNITVENTTVNETDTEVTSEVGTEDGYSITEQNLSKESRSTSTSVVHEDLSNDTTLTIDDSTTSAVFITTLSTDPTKSEFVSVSDADIRTSSETESETSSSTGVFPSVSVTGYTTESSNGGSTSTMITDSITSNGQYVTKSVPIIPEHKINIRSIKIAKIVLSVLLLMTGLIAVVMLAVYLFKVRRGAVQYDQLTLLP